MNRLAITEISKGQQNYTAYIMLDEKRDFVDFQLYEEEEKTRLGQIYIGMVENILMNIHAAFIRIGEDERCFLPLSGLNSPIFTKKQSKKKELSIGDELLVQVERDAVKTKEAVVTTKLTLNGKYSVLTTDNERLGVSKKLPEEKRSELLFALQELLSTEKEAEERDYGIVIRTNAANVSSEELKEDLKDLIGRYKKMAETARYKSAYTLLWKSAPGYIGRLKSTDFTGIDSIYTDRPEIYDTIKQEIPHLLPKLVRYEDQRIGLHALYNIGGNIDKLLAKRVWLKSGANIIIEQLETLTVIDVNTGKNIAGSDHVILEVNKEAAKEAARQLRLRNISGMIIIDFINMKSKAHTVELTEYLKQQLTKDTVPCSFIDITRLGLVEITRKKVYRSLKEILA